MGILALCVTAYTAYLQREQYKLAAAAPKKGAARLLERPWWNSASFMALLIITALAWAPWGIATWQNWNVLRVGVGVTAWGPAGPDSSTLQIVVYGSEVRTNEKLIAVALHYKGDADIMDVSDIQVSAPYDFRLGVQALFIKPDQHYLDEVRAGLKGTQFFLLMTPTTISRDQFHTLRQATTLGAKILWGGIAPA